jgi:hypothetical protein
MGSTRDIPARRWQMEGKPNDVRDLERQLLGEFEGGRPEGLHFLLVSRDSFMSVTFRLKVLVSASRNANGRDSNGITRH